ncbi:ethanolamine ammonia-lyase reactivating factor EutA [Paenibacillus thiaminolyticus]|uniref:Ethanolamine ammonia-lyase reactivating factor EutA n=1 Tax=Paenibacillus thiaminolyticus TaxID=49283 RepID=A0AAP9DTX4_PANTH|nr:ethanolamine ammonia-lyase reactivating factor EutA [Paenibacillus thiaminolyticus]MCY9533716.1 ethanolamine ammonia-lyase reactivating factor EutA [Paenibacillus thiaminolyticus]MCY9600207.1 ethanolamine ammonia-lyase reactivating factor EutA [Paenibacillus thiaminolyticus]MCY9607767.1 ethanolamine ammonia-lyase reactivating factor EutA [Paenibacillus thiaminolyticus]MCY9611980.1 ethanolamine ammonia-lyase reactivating factor EutA [Paenibacillus thiaminolyticus]MCY9617800.1 ethanolamine am
MNEQLLSVGIDMGTSTTQLVLSKLHIQNLASSFSVPRLVITDKEVVYRSDICFTPVLADNRIDAGQIQTFVQEQYRKAGIRKEEIQTGAVIITGETARKDNANEVLQSLSGFAGDFVVATAGPDLESIIAAKGAGAHTYSKEHSTSIVNIDIGGGTSNLALFADGELLDTGCLDIGGRLIKVDQRTHEITYIAPKIKRLAERRGLQLALGQQVTPAALEPIIGEMVKLLEESVGLRPPGDFYDTIVTNKGLKLDRDIPCISFSGGVADYVYQEASGDVFQYGDIGILLGRAIAASPLRQQMTVARSAETIRATVVGAGSHTTEISGSTITYTEESFPIKNIPILKLASADESGGAEALAQAIADKLNWFKLNNDLQRVAIALEGKKSPSFQEVQKYAHGLREGMAELLEREYPLIVIVHHDMAKVLGQTLYALLDYKKDVVCIDSVQVDNGDYIDIGKPIAEGKVLPVVIKTLVFH